MAGRNILLITTDQERWFADDPVPLPAHAWLRDHGTVFDRFYAASVACSPARSVIYTGQHTRNTGVLDNLGVPGQASMSSEIPTLATMLAARGYRSAYKGKWHLSDSALAGGAEGPLPNALVDYGFTNFNDTGDDLGGAYEGHHRDGAIARDAANWLNTEGVAANRAGTPWFLAVNLINPHDIMWASPDKAPPDAEIYRCEWDLPDDPSWLQVVDSPSRPSAHLDYSTAQQLWTGPPVATRDELRQFRSYYLNCLREVDAAAMSVIEGLQQAGLSGDTVIVFTSDHGEMAGAHGLFGKGPCSYDANIRIPLIIVDPARPGGQSRDTIGSQVDLVPTILSLAGDGPSGDSPTKGLPGVDLSSALDGPEHPGPREAALFVYESLSFVDGDWAQRTFVGYGSENLFTDRDLTKRGFIRTVIAGRYKFSRYFAPGDNHRPRSLEELQARNTLELFDLHEDPNEMSNLAAPSSKLGMEICEHMNAALASLFAAEVGADDGHWLPQLTGAPWTI